MRRRAVRLAGALLVLAALVTVPALAARHTHRDVQAARACATCVAAYHAPAVVTPAVAGPVSAAPTFHVVAPSYVAHASALASPRFGRAPPGPLAAFA
jgi:ABC-type Mn2+/Zn2+ transport system permease subunit